MFEAKNLDFGFIILCSDLNPLSLKITVNSLKGSHPIYPRIAIVPNEAKNNLIQEMKKFCEVFKGKEHFTSLINTGMRNAATDWNIFVLSGTIVKTKIADKLSRFITDDSDVLFPIVDRNFDFKHGTLNGLCIHKKTFKKVGPFAEGQHMEKLKEEWAIHAVACCNSKFKAILGAKIGEYEKEN